MQENRTMIDLLTKNFDEKMAKIKAKLENIERELSVPEIPIVARAKAARYEPEYRDLLTERVLYTKFGDVSMEIPTLERYLGFYMQRWHSRPTDSAVMPEVVNNLSDQVLAADYLARMLGTSDLADRGWYPVGDVEMGWLYGQALKFPGHPVSLQIKTMLDWSQPNSV